MRSLLRSVTAILGGAISGQLILLLSLPWLTRLLSPADLGYWSRTLALGMVVAVVITLRMEAAIFSTARRQRQESIAVVAMTAACGIATVLAVLHLLSPAGLRAALQLPETRDMLVLLAVGLGLALFNTATNLTAAYGRYDRLAVARPLRQLVEVAMLAGLALAGARAWLLPLSSVAGCLAGMAVQFRVSELLPERRLTRYLRVYLRLLGRYRSFLVYDLPAAALVHLRLAVPMLLLGQRYGLTVVGFFALAQRLIDAVVALAASSVGVVYRSELRRQPDPRRFFLMVLSGLLLAAGCLVGGVLLISEQAIAFAFGAEWVEVRPMLMALALYAVGRMVGVPLGFTFYVVERVGLNLLLQVIGMAAVLAAFAVASGGMSPTEVVTFYAIGQALFYGLYVLMAWLVLRPGLRPLGPGVIGQRPGFGE